MKYRILMLSAVLGSVGMINTANAYDSYPGDGGSDFYDTARVVDVKPIYRMVRVEHPRRECWNEEVRHDRSGYRSRTPAVLGGIIGGAVGNTMGEGRGKTAATIAGVLLGASIGRDAQRSEPAPDRYADTERVCRTVHDFTREQRIDGYSVSYRYRGRVYVTRMDHQPGKRIRVHVSVTPADG